MDTKTFPCSTNGLKCFRNKAQSRVEIWRPSESASESIQTFPYRTPSLNAAPGSTPKAVAISDTSFEVDNEDESTSQVLSILPLRGSIA